jgi:hypothetical protein
MNEENKTTQKGIYKTFRWRSPGGNEVAPMDAYRERVHMVSEHCNREKQEANQRLVEKKNKKKRSPPSGFIFDR